MYVGMAQWTHWLTKYTNKELCHTVVCTPYTMATLYSTSIPIFKYVAVLIKFIANCRATATYVGMDVE